MTDTSTPANGGEPMRAVVDNYGTLSGKRDEIPADLQPYADEILKMDPLRDVPGNVKDSGGYRPFKRKATALSPDLQREVYRKLDRMPNMSAEDRAKYEDQFVAEAIRGQLGSIRGMTGVGSDALPYHKAQAQIAMDVRTLYEKRNVYQESLDKIVGVKKGEDPVTGEVVANPVYWLSEFKRANYRDVIADIDRQIGLLTDSEGKPGIEGQKRLRKALIESAEIRHRQRTMHADEAEAQKRAANMLREESIEKRAAIIAKMRSSS